MTHLPEALLDVERWPRDPRVTISTLASVFFAAFGRVDIPQGPWQHPPKP